MNIDTAIHFLKYPYTCPNFRRYEVAVDVAVAALEAQKLQENIKKSGSEVNYDPDGWYE